MEGIGVLLFEPRSYSAGFDPRLCLGCTQKLLISTEACSTVRVLVFTREGSEIRYLVKPVVLATSQLLLSFLQLAVQEGVL